jgi:malate dehydrogenase (oxaloacetate-decarboxylating)(NADP+)
MNQNRSVAQNDRESTRKAALNYHEFPVPGKLSVTPTKQLTNQRDLALAYSPGVAAASEEIVADPANVFRYTARGNLVAVITNALRCWAWAPLVPWRQSL